MVPETSERREPYEDEAGFEYTNRPVRDLCWTVFFLVLVGVTCGLGIFAGIAKNEDGSQLFKRDYNEDSKYCYTPPDDTSNTVTTTGFEDTIVDDNRVSLVGVEPDGRPVRSLSQDEPEPEPSGREPQSEYLNNSSFLQFADHAWLWLLLSTFAAVVLGFIFVLLFSYFAAVMVYTVAVLLVFVPLGAGIILLVAYDDRWGWAYIAAGVVIAIPLLCLHSQLRLSSKLLDLGADGLRDNLDLVLFCICANLILLACLTGMLCFGILALMNGKIELNNGLDTDELPDHCVARFSRRIIDCCDWNMDNWVSGYWVLLIVMALWIMSLFNQIKVYVVAGVVSQWYFAEEGKRGNMSIFKSLGFALTSSFGSLTLSSLILTISNIIQRISQWLAKQAEEENSRFKWLATCLSCLIGVIAHLIEWVTDFATVRMAITGESFFSAGKSVVEMMTKNFINAYAIWWFPPIVLFVCSFIISVSTAAVLALAARNTWNDEDDLHDVRAWSWYLFFLSFIIIMCVLNFFSTLLIDAANTIFVCFAIDRENKTQKNLKAHEVFQSLGILDKTPLTAGAGV